jgi:hypothetical protein
MSQIGQQSGYGWVDGRRRSLTRWVVDPDE